MTIYEETQARASRIAGNLKRIRESKHLSQTQLGKMCGMSNVSISRIERGDTLATVYSMIQLTSALGVTFEDLTE